ncbi:MAG: hypothetical protein IJV24_03140 [Prevotella sp.]|nr:hypothetical protein [Prevotella sp.]
MDIKKFFQRKQQGQGEAQPLAIEGIAPAPMTPEPDDAELAAQALLEVLLAQKTQRQKKWHRHGRKSAAGTAAEAAAPSPSGQDSAGTSPRDAAYYHRLREKIYAAHDAARLRTLRFVAFCEQELKNTHLPAYGPGSLALLETELYKRIDTIEREGGDLKRRWQHCLANVTVRMMQAANHGEADSSPTTDGADLS